DDEDKEEEYELTNDPVEFPKMQAELSKNAADELEEDSKLFSLIQLEPDEFVSQMVRIPILKFNDVTREIKTINDFMSVSKNAYKHHSLYNDDIIEENLDFASAVTRSPTSGKGLAFVVEAAIAYGKNIKVPSKASDAVFRFVNRTPKLRDNTDCAIWKTISIVNWKNYKLDTFDNGIPKGPVRVFVNVSGPFVHLMFKSQSKQALAEDDNLMKEIKLALEQVGRRLRTYLTKRAKHQERKKRASKFLQFAPYISRSLFNILDRAGSSQDLAEPEEIEEKLIGSIGKKPIETKVNAVSLDVEPKTSTKRLAPPAKKSEKPKVSKKKEPEKPKETKEDSKAQVQKTLVSKTPPKETKSTKSPPSPKKTPPGKKSEPEKPAGPLKINEENILKRLPSDKPVKISYLIKALGIKDITDARFLDMKLKILMKNGRVERSKIEGKSYFRKIE
ncbi:hypothetical protein GF325_13625, partial [Candidatus Bathyarchaeota archaeon]|nr:hypothetical protein [Candidatus Bathyarchaeota archaeon]